MKKENGNIKAPGTKNSAKLPKLCGEKLLAVSRWHLAIWLLAFFTTEYADFHRVNKTFLTRPSGGESV
jgi:hypothetical protein